MVDKIGNVTVVGPEALGTALSDPMKARIVAVLDSVIAEWNRPFDGGTGFDLDKVRELRDELAPLRIGGIN